jgi:type IV pilus assembly protein PilX
MLSGYVTRRLDGKPIGRQQGIVLMIALLVLVAMSVAGIALVRSVYTTNIIAGNIAFQQAATNSADTGIEAAITWLQLNSGCSPACTLADNKNENGYSAYRADPGAGQSWETFWKTLADANQVVTLAKDASGNKVSYAIHRLCNGTGAPNDAGCAVAPAIFSSSAGNDQSNPDQVDAPTKVYYRITSRVSGPRNTVSFVQVVVAM